MSVKTARRIRIAGSLLFILYIFILVYVLFLSEKYGRAAGMGEMRYNLVPTREIRRFVRHAGILGKRAVFLNLAGNILLFVPFGAILPVLVRKTRSFLAILLLSAALSALVEFAQLMLRAGACDVDDVILNTLGGMLGWVIFAFCNEIRRKIYG